MRFLATLSLLGALAVEASAHRDPNVPQVERRSAYDTPYQERPPPGGGESTWDELCGCQQPVTTTSQVYDLPGDTTTTYMRRQPARFMIFLRRPRPRTVIQRPAKSTISPRTRQARSTILLPDATRQPSLRSPPRSLLRSLPSGIPSGELSLKLESNGKRTQKPRSRPGTSTSHRSPNILPSP
ncbi:hypothetical protein B0J13DRAFT_284312 [Dactylonectria estremocensis]|uniref:Uncharacterized protein n=1 Tax=Dactylonectria estremocensis TaxID=1079267 RepID=A0A9P9F2T4_9HYPO|nr:hypothetical protein B0J13DRAFT_284312 [Dactylonectria estremocensis]